LRQRSPKLDLAHYFEQIGPWMLPRSAPALLWKSGAWNDYGGPLRHYGPYGPRAKIGEGYGKKI
jgi:hypothetical protein